MTQASGRKTQNPQTDHTAEQSGYPDLADAELACPPAPVHAGWMFVVTDSEATAIRAAFDQGGELSAAVELRRLIPGIVDTMQAREWVRIIAGWKPLPTLARHR